MRRWSIVGLFAVLVFSVWWRGHTVGPSLKAKLGVDLYPVTSVEDEPLDCDEAIYAYIGNRIAHGAVMYKDMTENKPPGGYWAYALTTGLFGSNELTVRLMPIPIVLATIGLVWWIVLRLSGPGSAVVAALVYAVVSTDPFLHGNGANMEPIINLFSTAALAIVVACWERPGRFGLLVTGVCLGLAMLVKQVVIVHVVVFALGLLLRGIKDTEEGEELRSIPSRIVDAMVLLLGVMIVWGCATGIVIGQGAGRQAFEDIFRYGRALATETPAPEHAPPGWMRWVTGNADPEGRLPWPFGATTYLVWWGTGTWPIWVTAIPGMLWLAVGLRTTGPRRLAVAWTLAAWVEVAIPGLFWQHYYLLPVPGLAIVVATFLGDQFVKGRGWFKIAVSVLLVPAILAAIGWTGWLGWTTYLKVAPEDLTRYNGGKQWNADRSLGREIAKRSQTLEKPKLFLWGWQSPLYFYSGLEPATRQLFTDDFLRAFAESNHPQARPRIDRIMSDLNAAPPALIFAGYPPFPELKAFLEKNYLPSRMTTGLWVEKSKFRVFEAADEPH